MKQHIVKAIGWIMCLLTMTGCTRTVSCGDAKIEMKKNLFNSMVYWLDSPSFSVGYTNTVEFQYRDLPEPALPKVVIVERSQGKLYDAEQAGSPAYLSLKIKVTCLDTNGVAYFSRTVDFSTLEKGNVWPHAQNILPSAAKSDLRTDFDVRIEILTPSNRKQDKAYLYSPLLFPDGFPKRQ